MSESIPPTRQALAEALALSTEILRNLELSELQLTNIALKASRLARLLNDFDTQKILEYEVAGYPSTPDGVPPDVYRLARLAGREFSQRDQFAIVKAEASKKYIYLDSIESLEQQIRNSEFAIAAARDPENPGPPRKSPFGNVELIPGNVVERTTRLKEAQQAAQRLASRRNFIYQYVLGKHYELKFSGIADDIFSRIRGAVDAAIGQALPESVKRLSAAYENLRSDNPEDWSNAVHSCRRILRDLADAIFPSTNEIREIRIEGRSAETNNDCNSLLIRLDLTESTFFILVYVSASHAARVFRKGSASISANSLAIKPFKQTVNLPIAIITSETVESNIYNLLRERHI